MSEQTTFTFSGRSVLVVEDEAVSRSMLSKLLHNLNSPIIEEASDGADALNKLESMDRYPDIIFVDINMPTMNGPELLRELAARSYDGFIVLVSDMDSETLDVAEQLALMRGINVAGVISKPVTASRLVALLEMLQFVD